MASVAVVILVSPIAKIVIDKLVDFLKEDVVRVLGVKKELTGMQRQMRMIMVILEEVERRSLFDEYKRQQVRDLKDIFYDIDDLIDDCKAQRLLPSDASAARTGITQLITSSSRWKNFMFSREIAKRIKKMNDKMEEIAKQNRTLGDIAPNVRDGQQSGNKVAERKKLCQPDDDIVGDVEKEARTLMNLMTNKKEPAGTICVDLAIVGMGGVGKATLARKIFDVSGDCQPKMWIQVLKDRREEDLLKEVVRAAGGSHGQLESVQELTSALEEVVKGKQIFLALIDVWNDDIWCKLLQKSLKSCKEGSKVLITTTNLAVARRTSPSHLHHVQLLAMEEGLSLLLKTIGEETNSMELRDIGAKIVEKCGRLPLAIKTIAGILKEEESKQKRMRKILDSEVWALDVFKDSGDVMKTLYLSYEDLSPELKQCFMYCCSLLPEDIVLDRGYIAALWVAEGFFKDNEPLDSAINCYDELVSRNLLQQASFRNTHRIHNLVRNFGRNVGSDENFFGNINALGEHVRRLSIVDGISLENPDRQRFHEKLRTLMLFKSPGLEKIPEGLFRSLQYLRVLLLSNTGIGILPDSIKSLKHLKFLDLTGTKIEKIPDSIGDLRNLQFLHLMDCEHLKAFPDTICNLHNLIMLFYSPGIIKHLPKTLRGLTKLQHLVFIVAEEGTELGCPLKELGNLKSLRRLYVRNLHRNLSSDEVRSADLRSMDRLEQLTLYFTGEEDTINENVKKIEGVFEALHPPSSLERLWVNNFCGRSFPSWMSSSNGISLGNLVQLSIDGCKYCEQLPQLGKLRHLRRLDISQASKIQEIGLEFLGSGTRVTNNCIHPFPKLEALLLKDFPNLKKWWWDGVDPFPCLLFLGLQNCPSLRQLPGLPTVQQLSIVNCPSLKGVGNMRDASKVLWGDEILTDPPRWFQSLASTMELKIFTKQPVLLQKLCPWPLGIGSDWHLIKKFPKVIARQTSGESYVVYSSSPFKITGKLPNTEFSCEDPSLISDICGSKTATTCPSQPHSGEPSRTVPFQHAQGETSMATFPSEASPQ